MRIGFVCSAVPSLPAHDGFRLSCGNLVRVLSRRNRVDLIALGQPGDEDRVAWAAANATSVAVVPLRASSVWRRFANVTSAHLFGRPLHGRQAVAEVVRHGIESKQWDVLHVEGGFVAGLVPPTPSIPRVLAIHDSGTLRCVAMAHSSSRWSERLYYSLMWHHERRYARLVYPRFDRCVVVAERDAVAVRELVPQCLVPVIPNGTDTEYFRPLPVAQRGATLVFHGNLAYAPNVDAVLHLATTILPLVQESVSTARLLVVGANPTATIRALDNGGDITVLADLADLREAVCAGSVYVCPMRLGSGVKNKVLEAMAMGLPIVCYSSAVAGIECVPGRDLIVCDDPGELARAVAGLLVRRSRAEALGRAARALAQRSHGWERYAARFEELYREVIGERCAVQVGRPKGIRIATDGPTPTDDVARSAVR